MESKIPMIIKWLALNVPHFCIPWLVFEGWNGFSTPFFIVTKDDSVKTIKHERAHVFQWWHYGIIGFILVYLYQILMDGSWDSPLEIAARQYGRGYLFNIEDVI